VTARPRVLIADDHPPTRAGVRMALEQGGCEVCAEVANAADAVTAALREQPDVCLIDIDMPGNGFRAVVGIVSRMPGVRVVMLTVSHSSEDLFDALRAGAAGYLLKDMDPSELPVAVRAAARGEAALPGSLTAMLIEEFRQRGSRRTLVVADRNVELTPREWDVIELLADGLSTAEMARRLGISDVTIRRHVSGLMQKLDVASRDEMRRLVGEQSRQTRPCSSD
jgi:DNA-binding NarL/FixJ family response regulator